MKSNVIFKWTLLTAMLLGVSYSCNKDDDDNYNQKKVTINFVIKNAQGQNMFDSITPNNFNKNTMNIWYMIGGQKVPSADITDFVTGIFVYPPSAASINQYFAQVCLNADLDESYPTTLVQWNTNIVDTIKGHWTISGSAVNYDSLWINNQLRYAKGSAAYPYNDYIEEIK
jgi:hypothetical protein